MDCVQEENLSAIQVAPERTGSLWFLCLQRLLSVQLWELPWNEDALSQAGGPIRSYAPPPLGLATERLI